jgi:hypothetical protein
MPPEAMAAAAPGRTTYAQASIFFADQQSPFDGAYNYATRVEVTGPRDDKQLAEACRRLTRATPALRVRMGIDEWTGEVVYWFVPDDPEVRIHDCTGAPAMADAIIDAATLEPFDVDEGPLTRYLVLRTGPGRAIAAVVTHHLILDGLSHARLAERFAQCLAGAVPPDDSWPYVQLVERIRVAEVRARKADRGYWLDRVPARVLEAAAVPFTAGPVPFTAEPPTRHLLTIDGQTRSGLRQLGAECGTSLFQTLVAAVHHALPSRAGAPSLLCAATSQRPVEGTHQDVIGCFINMVPLLAQRHPGESAWDLLRRESGQWAQDVRRRHFPLVELVHHLDPTHRLSRMDSVMVSYRRSSRAVEVIAGGVRCTASLVFSFPAAKTDLSVRFFDHGESLWCEVQWAPGVPEPVGAAVLEDLLASFSSAAGLDRQPVRVGGGVG